MTRPREPRHHRAASLLAGFALGFSASVGARWVLYWWLIRVYRADGLVPREPTG